MDRPERAFEVERNAFGVQIEEQHALPSRRGIWRAAGARLRRHTSLEEVGRSMVE